MKKRSKLESCVVGVYRLGEGLKYFAVSNDSHESH